VEEAVAGHGAAARFLHAAGERDSLVLAEHYRLGQQLDNAAAAISRRYSIVKINPARSAAIIGVAEK
jgi:hypothetical protein